MDTCATRKSELGNETGVPGLLQLLLLTVEILGAAVEALLVLLALLGGRLLVAERRREDARAVLHQKLDHGQVVARGGAVQRRPFG